MALQNGEVLIHEGNYEKFIESDGTNTRARGLKPRNYETHPQGFYSWAPKASFPLIPRSEWRARISDMEANKSRCSDVRMKGNNGAMIPSRDQNGKGYCWAHSSTAAVIMLRALNGDPYVSLSAYMVACIIKGYKDEGGWGAESMDFIVKNGVASDAFWPQQSMSSKNDTPAMRANALLHLVSEDWMDLQVAEYDRTLSFDQEITLLLCRNPVVKDENWWGHSILGVDAVYVANSALRDDDSGKLANYQAMLQAFEATDGFGVRIWNSWGDSWSDNGMGVLSGTKAISDGAVAAAVTLPTAA